MAEPRITETRLAEFYAVSPKTLSRYKRQGIDIWSPNAMLSHMIANGSARMESLEALEVLARGERKEWMRVGRAVMEAGFDGHMTVRCPHCEAVLVEMDSDLD